MKTLKTLLICAALIAGVSVSAQQPAKTQDKKAKTETVTFDVSLHCHNCQAKIEKNIPWEKGVKELQVDLENKQVTITYDPKKTNEDTLKKAIEELGYECTIPGDETADGEAA